MNCDRASCCELLRQSIAPTLTLGSSPECILLLFRPRSTLSTECVIIYVSLPCSSMNDVLDMNILHNAIVRVLAANVRHMGGVA